jgi:coenzyme PQQ precursor peptide PqqA
MGRIASLVLLGGRRAGPVSLHIAVPRRAGHPLRIRKLKELVMAWTTPVVAEVCVGMEVTSYESAEI